MKKNILLGSLLSMTLVLPTLGYAQDKHHEDPTNVVTQVGVGYNDGLTLSGSIGLDDARKINLGINGDGSEWRFGGSWLFDIGIINFNFNRADYDDDVYRNSYSVGTFIPLSIFGFTPGGWQIFPMAGYNYTDGEQLIEATGSPISFTQLTANDFILTPNSSHGGYLGAFALKPLTENISIIATSGGMVGSNSYSGYWAAGGASYKINKQQSFNVIGVVSNDDYGKRNEIEVSYTYQFK